MLQYEIVFFDQVEVIKSDSSNQRIIPLQHGKSCLFEIAPEELDFDLEDTPLTILLLKRPVRRELVVNDMKAQLFAFTCIDLEKNPARRTLHAEIFKYQICEWASKTGVWKLLDQANREVGSLVATVTLSCLGKALAPHLSKAIGLEVEKIQNGNDPKDNEVLSPSHATRKNNQVDFEETRAFSETVPKTTEVGIQCHLNEDFSFPLSKLQPKLSPRNRHGKIIMMEPYEKKTVSPRRSRSPSMGHKGGTIPLLSYVDELPSFLRHDLPPPLFFQKPSCNTKK
jgi:hypothetical protein